MKMIFFIARLQILVWCKTKGAVRALCALLRICPLTAEWPITVRDGALELKGSQRMRGGRIFLKTFGAHLFSEDLSNEPNFGRVHLAGQYL